jgi:hypothetical protein
MKAYDFIEDYVMNNDEISESRKYDMYKAIKKLYINIAKNDYEYLCYTINGSYDSTGQCAITREYARELLKYSQEEMDTFLEILLAEHITELQGGMIVL